MVDGPQRQRGKQQRKAQAHARGQDHREVTRVRQFHQAQRLGIGGGRVTRLAAGLGLPGAAARHHPVQHHRRQVAGQLGGAEEQPVAAAEAAALLAGLGQRKDVGPAMAQVGAEHLQVDGLAGGARRQRHALGRVVRGVPQVAEGQRLVAGLAAGGALDQAVQPGRQRFVLRVFGQAGAQAEAVVDHRAGDVLEGHPGDQAGAGHRQRQQRRQLAADAQRQQRQQQATGRAQPVGFHRAGDHGQDALVGAARVQRIDQHAEQPPRGRLRLEQAEQLALAGAHFGLQLLRQGFQQVEAGTAAAVAALVLGRRRHRRGNGAGRRAADVLEAVVARQLVDGARVDHAAGDAALHHQITEAVERRAGLGGGR